MKYPLIIPVLLLSTCSIRLGAQDPSPAPSTSSSPDSGADPAPILQQPTIQNCKLYRVSSKTGILAANGSEIILPNVPNPKLRQISMQQGHLEVIDTLMDDNESTTLWNIDSLTYPYMPSKNGPHTNAVVLDDGPHEEPDALPGEAKIIYQRTDEDQIRLGSVFVDDANRLFYFPPDAPIFFQKPDEVFKINVVTHLPMNNVIALEWTKDSEDTYHVVTLDVDSQVIIKDFTPDSKIEAQQELTWADGLTLIGKFRGRNFEEYATIDLNQNAVTAKASSANGLAIKARGGSAQAVTVVDQ